MKNSKFAIHWLIAAGVPPDKASEKSLLARERARRYPIPICWLYPLLLLFVEWLFPLLLLCKFSRASSLSPDDFDRLEQKAHHGSYCFFRIIYTLARLPLWEQLYPEEPPDRETAHPLQHKLTTPAAATDFDVIVVGSGAGGAPLSWALSRQGWRVAIVESGELARPHTADFAIEHYFLNQAFTVTTQGGFIPILAGNTVGGTTSINSGTCLRPPRERLLEWDQTAGTHFAAGLLNPYFDIAEKMLGVTVSARTLLSASDRLFEQGLIRLGRHESYVLPRNAPQCEGSGRCCFICPSGAKRTTDLAFLPDAIAHGCTLFAHTTATRICETSDGVLLTVTTPAGNYLLHSRKLVLAAGAFGTPHLIRRNRLGTLWHEAGNHLKVHPASKVFAYFDEPVHSERGVPQGLGYIPPEFPRITLEGIFTPKSTAPEMIAAAGERHRWWLDRYDHLASFGLMLREYAEGKVRFIGKWPWLRYRMTLEDVRNFRDALVLCAEVFLAAGARRILLPMVGLPNELASEKELDALRTRMFKESQLLACGFHPQGTAGLSRIVDLSFTLKGTRNIYVCDASVLPGSPGVNPQVSIMGLSLYLADMLQHRLP